MEVQENQKWDWHAPAVEDLAASNQAQKIHDNCMQTLQYDY